MRKRRKQAETGAPQLEPKRVSPVDIQQKEFRLAMRGYNERDVDQFLDEVTEEVARLYADNKRLREEVEFGKTTRLDTSGAAEVEGVIRQAREEAARIIADATARASTIGAPDPAGHAAGSEPASGSPPNEIMGVFLARERAFLQNMANLIQAHAEGVKQDVRRVREQVSRHVPAAESPVARSTPAESRTATEPPGEAPVESEAEEAESSQRDIVDLTEEGSRPPEGAAEGAAGGSGQASDAEAALARAYGRPPAPRDARDGSPRPTEAMAGGGPVPGVDDDDTREDRSIRELFWGED